VLGELLSEDEAIIYIVRSVSMGRNLLDSLWSFCEWPKAQKGLYSSTN